MSLAFRVALFTAAGAVVLWHSSRVTVLWDITYILEIAHRLTLGLLPYRDYIVPQAPLTFLAQAAILKLSGGGLLPHFVWCAGIAGLTAVLTHALIRTQLFGIERGLTTVMSAAIAAPVVFLNGYAILPLPFYDPDGVAFVLLSLAAVVWARRGDQPWRDLLAGVLLVIPVFGKQNIGIAACGLTHLALVLDAWRHPERRAAYPRILGASIATFIVALLLLGITVGLPAYYQWTVSYAAARRLAGAGTFLSFYGHPRTIVAIAFAVVGFAVATRARTQFMVLAGLALVLLPWVDAARTMARWGLASRAFALWGVAGVGAALAVSAAWRAGDWRFERTLPLIAIGIAHGAFASQGVADSAYGVWPMLLIALAAPVGMLLRAIPTDLRRTAALLTSGAFAMLTVLGYLHVARNERLGFADLSGAVAHATHPRIRGFATPGPYFPDFDRLLARVAALIPQEARVLTVPGEDPFFFASGRTPTFPIVLFDDTAAPHDAPTVARMLDEYGIEWIVVKRRLQLRNSPWRHLDELVATHLPRRYAVVEEVGPYVVLRRR